MEAAKREIMNLFPTSMKDKPTLRKAVLHLDKGLKNIATRQKQIKIADRSELGWQVVAYESDELASDSDNEKQIFGAEKGVEKRSKRKWAATTGFRKQVALTKVAQMMPWPAIGTEGLSALEGAACSQYTTPRQLGPCFSCGQWGHLVASCPVRTSKAGCPF